MDEGGLAREVCEVMQRLISLRGELKNRYGEDRSEVLGKLIDSALQQLKKLHACLKYPLLPPLEGESYEHFMARNLLIAHLEPEQYFEGEVRLGRRVPDALIKVGGEWVLVEVETNPRRCVEKIRNAEEVWRYVRDHAYEYDREIYWELKRQWDARRSLKLVLGVLRKPDP